jgi:hypothetical protein
MPIANAVAIERITVAPYCSCFDSLGSSEKFMAISFPANSFWHNEAGVGGIFAGTSGD